MSLSDEIVGLANGIAVAVGYDWACTKGLILRKESKGAHDIRLQHTSIPIAGMTGCFKASGDIQTLRRKERNANASNNHS